MISVITAVCGILACRRKRVPPPPGPAHWSTHVTVTPNCRSSRDEGGARQGGDRPQSSTTDRVALIAFADQDPVVLPSYEEALRDGVPSTRTSTTATSRERGQFRQHPPHRRSRAHQDHLPVQVTIIQCIRSVYFVTVCHRLLLLKHRAFILPFISS